MASKTLCDSTDQDLLRVCVWSLPRTLGTALFKCMSFVDEIQIFYEPFVSAFHLGPEGLTPVNLAGRLENYIQKGAASEAQMENAFDDSMCTYKWVKQQLETDYPGKKILLTKNHAYCLQKERYDMIPSGFRHAFLIRHPYKVLPSWKKMVGKILGFDNDDSFSWEDLEKQFKQPTAYEMQCNLLKHVKKNLDPKVIVIDADDLQRNPASILSQFCQDVGIQYSDSFLEWPEDRDIMKTWKASRINLQGNLLEKEGGFFEVALKSTAFLPPKPIPERNELSQDLQIVADYSMSFYEEMRKIRLQP